MADLISGQGQDQGKTDMPKPKTWKIQLGTYKPYHKLQCYTTTIVFRQTNKPLPLTVHKILHTESVL